MTQIVAYLACSLDGYIAGPDDSLDWLPTEQPEATEGVVTFEAMLARTGVLVMGRRTYDVVRSFGVWPYAGLPVWVWTRRPLVSPPEGVVAVDGEAADVAGRAVAAADGKDVYVDGGRLMSAVLEAGLLDELIVTTVPVLLAGGVPLYGGRERVALEVRSVVRYGTLVQTRYVPTR